VEVAFAAGGGPSVTAVPSGASRPRRHSARMTLFCGFELADLRFRGACVRDACFLQVGFFAIARPILEDNFSRGGGVDLNLTVTVTFSSFFFCCRFLLFP